MERQLGSAYVLEDLVGRGATGEVWSARHVPDDARVAVKVLRPEFTEDPELVARFVQERSLLLGLDSPHLVKVRDLVVEGSTLAIVMDLVSGSDLRHLMREQPLSPDLAIDLAIQVLDGLSVVHAAGVVHRDLKPENILVDRTDPTHLRALITDFGVARLAHGPSLTKVTGLIGTPIYMAPELSERATPTAAADLYSAGIVLYEMLAGRPPFDASHPMAVLRAHLEERPAPIPGLPNAVGVVLASLLEKDPADRPADAVDARTRLESARSSVLGMVPFRADDPDSPVDPYATTLPDLGDTRLGGRRSNPPRDTPTPTQPTGDKASALPLVSPTHESSPGRVISRRTVVAAVTVVVVLLGGSVAFAALGTSDDKKVATTQTSARRVSTTVTAVSKPKPTKPKPTKPKPTKPKPTKPRTVTTSVPNGGNQGAPPGSNGPANAGGGPAPTAVPPTPPPPPAPTTTPTTTPKTVRTTPTTHPTPTVVVFGPTLVCDGSVINYTATITNATSWYWQDVHGQRQYGGNSVTVAWNVGPGTFKIELRAENPYRYYDNFKTVKVVTC